MNKIMKFISALIMLLCLLMTSVLPCMAVETDGEICVSIEDAKKKEVEGLTISICKIAELDETGYYPSDAFKDSGISIAGIVNDPSAVNAKTVYDYVIKNDLNVRSNQIKNGKAVFETISDGIWLVFCEENGTHRFAPYIIFMPYEQNGKLNYQVTSTPKLEENKPNNKNIYLLKKWEDKNNAAKIRPKSVEILLYRDGKKVESVLLNEACGWSHTFTNLPVDGNYSIEEKPVTYYVSQVSGDSENGFIVTNTYNGDKLPQTGQLWWPITILCVAGTLFVLLGIIHIGAHKNDKK